MNILAAASILALAASPSTWTTVDPITVTAASQISPCAAGVHTHHRAKPGEKKAHHKAVKHHGSHKRRVTPAKPADTCDAAPIAPGGHLDLSGLVAAPVVAAPDLAPVPEDAAPATPLAQPDAVSPLVFPPQPDDGDSFIIGGAPGTPGGGGGGGPGGGGGSPGCTVNCGGSGGVTPPPAVPEPATWAEMILGSLLVGVVLRRRVRVHG